MRCWNIAISCALAVLFKGPCATVAACPEDADDMPCYVGFDDAADCDHMTSMQMCLLASDYVLHQRGTFVRPVNICA